MRACALHRAGQRRSMRTSSTMSRSSAPGPAGLATAVYAASEGLSVAVLDCRAFGGQAGASARIENYLGFPTGITGMALMGRAYNQAQKFGAETGDPARGEEPRGERQRLFARSSPARRALQSALGRARLRRGISAARCHQSRRVRCLRALLGLAAGSQALRRAGSRAGRRRQFGRTGRGLSREPGREGVDDRARDATLPTACRAIWSIASPRNPISRW